jgi:hypothetical protein
MIKVSTYSLQYFRWIEHVDRIFIAANLDEPEAISHTPASSSQDLNVLEMNDRLLFVGPGLQLFQF